MAKRKQSGFSADFQEQLLKLTQDSPLLAIGTVQKRFKIRGKSDKGDWEMMKVEIRGCDGRMTTVTVNDPANIPPLNEVIVLPVYVGQNGNLREARNLAEEVF